MQPLVYGLIFVRIHRAISSLTSFENNPVFRAFLRKYRHPSKKHSRFRVSAHSVLCRRPSMACAASTVSDISLRIHEYHSVNQFICEIDVSEPYVGKPCWLGRLLKDQIEPVGQGDCGLTRQGCRRNAVDLRGASFSTLLRGCAGYAEEDKAITVSIGYIKMSCLKRAFL